MSRRSQVFSLMVLTEDSGAGAYDTVRALAKAMLRLIDPEAQTDRIGFKPLSDEGARRAMGANRWKSKNPLDQPEIVLLARSIATELLKPRGFVLYHIDGDRRWSERHSSENESLFKKEMLPRIQNAVAGALRKLGRPAEEHSAVTDRFHLMVPFFSIEAWVYQNTRKARTLCEDEGCGGCGANHLDRWERDRASLDEEVQPKERTLCFRDKHNEQLASSGFPAGQVFDANTSFAHVTTRLLECAQLTEALRETWASTPTADS